MKTNLIFLTFSFIYFGTIHSQPYNYEPEIIDSLLTGIPVKKIVWDSKDTLWFLSNTNGLHKSYGDSVWFYNKENSNLTSETIKSIAIDSKDTIWLVTERGLVKFDHGIFTRYDTTNTDIPAYSYHELAVDKDDNIWFSSSRARKGGIIKYDKNEFHLFTPDNSPLPTSYIATIAIDHDNNVWVATSEITYEASIIKIAGDEWTVYNEDNTGISLYFFMFKSIVVDSDNNILVRIDYSASSSSTNGKPSLIKFDGTNWEVLLTVAYNEDCSNMFGLDINDNIWTISPFTTSVLRYFDGQAWNIWGKPKYSIYDVKVGIDGATWLLTSNGIYVLETEILDIANSISKPEEINIFPNPTRGIINIDLDGYDCCVVYNMLGVCLLTTQNRTIDMRPFHNGMYVLQVKDKSGKNRIKKILLEKN